MNYLIPVAAWVQTLWDRGTAALDRVRRRILVPLVLTGRRDMVMLTNGQWVDDPCGAVPRSSVRWIYDAEKHTVHSVRLVVGEDRIQRWPWLTLVTGGGDFTEFLTGLRASASVRPAAILALLACQMRMAPVGRLQVTLRDGTEAVLSESGEPVVAAGDITSSVNHIQ